tara:strand:- start:447 stop:587 length:141 start_codon:yes stop_codon:yes gene_type:complete
MNVRINEAREVPILYADGISDIKLKIYIEVMNEIKAVHRMYHITLG